MLGSVLRWAFRPIRHRPELVRYPDIFYEAVFGKLPSDPDVARIAQHRRRALQRSRIAWAIVTVILFPVVLFATYPAGLELVPRFALVLLIATTAAGSTTRYFDIKFHRFNPLWTALDTLGVLATIALILFLFMRVGGML